MNPFTSLTRSIMARIYGQSFLGQRDTYTSFGYPQPDELKVEDFFELYERGDIAARLVEIYPEAIYAEGANFVSDDDPEVDDPFEAEAKSLYTDLNIWSNLLIASILSHVGEYSIIWLGASGDVSTPLGTNEIFDLWPVRQTGAVISEFEKDTANKRFGLPKIYTVRISPEVESKRVHWSRVLHLTGHKRDSRVFGQPDLKRVYNRFRDLEKLIGGSAEAFYQNADPHKIYNRDPELKWPMEQKEKDELKEQFDNIRHKIDKDLYLRGIDTKILNPRLHNFSPQALLVLKIICGSQGIPWRILFGTQESTLAGTADTDMFNRRVSQLRNADAEPLIRHLNDVFITTGQLSDPGEYEIVWPVQGELDEEGKATVAGKIALANKQQVDAGQDPVMTSTEMRKRFYDEGPIEVTSSNEEGNE